MTTHSKQLIIFDKDGTLTLSKSRMDEDMARLFMQLLARKKVAIISGSGMPLFETQILSALPHESPHLSNLILLPVSGTRLYTWRGQWNEQYAEHLSPRQKEKIMVSLNTALEQAHFERPTTIYGQLIEDRGSQITFSALGQNAPLGPKHAWDPTRGKRRLIVSFLKEKIPEFDVAIGGATSIDITKRGVNKAYGIRKLEEYLKMTPDDIIFVGDALFPGGNDYPAKATGVDCIQVNSVEDTRKLIARWLTEPSDAVPKSMGNSASSTTFFGKSFEEHARISFSRTIS